ncbi:MAG: hemolysin family protein [Phycisphaerales bacterium]|nr:hemolysin family protein [Phycisphaerales bacterium]
MTGFLAWLLPLVAAVLTTWLATIEFTLRNGARGAVERALESRGRLHQWTSISHRIADVTACVSLLRLAVSMAFLVLWTVDFSGAPGAEFSTRGFFVGISTGIVGLWVLTSVLGAAISRWSAHPIVTVAIPFLQTCAVIGPLPGAVVRFADEVVKRLSGTTLAKNGEQSEAEAELLRSVEQSQRAGGLGETTAEMIENVVEFTSTDVGEVMTPRTEIEGIELTDDLAAIKNFIGQEGHSRIPVYEEDLDHITGILYVKDLVPFLGEDPATFRLQPLLRAPIVIPETKVVADLLADFQKSEVHMAIVVDEYGGTAGLVTIEDVLEEIVGEIKDEHEGEDPEEEPEIRTIADGRYEVDGRFHVDDLNEALSLELPEDEEYDTVGGYLMACLGRVPEQGESWDVDGIRLTALETSATQVALIGIERRARADQVDSATT